MVFVDQVVRFTVSGQYIFVTIEPAVGWDSMSGNRPRDVGLIDSGCWDVTRFLVLEIWNSNLTLLTQNSFREVWIF